MNASVSEGSQASLIADDSSNKPMPPIKKRRLDDDEEDDYDTEQNLGDKESPPPIDPAFRSGPGHHERSSEIDVLALEAKAKKDLYSFLANKGIDIREAHGYKVHIKPSRNRKSGDFYTPSYSVNYSGPDGSIFTSRGDVYTAIRDAQSRRHHARSSVRVTMNRSEIVEAAKKRFDEVVKNLPMSLDHVRVLNFGKIDAMNSVFNTSTQIYPIGYRAEISLPEAHPVRGGRFEYRPPSNVTVEIFSRDSLPEFVVTEHTIGKSFRASSEFSAWRKFDPFADETYSFFNLDTELLIEGMAGAEHCREYRFHDERGYGSLYHNQEEMIVEKLASMNRSDRERRNQQRQQTRHLRPEETQRLAELQKRREEDDKEHTKRLEALERERRNLEKEELKRRKEQERESLKEQRERQKQEELLQKGRQKAEDKVQRERNKLTDKVRSQYRRDFNHELKRVRGDANASVLQFFDEEESIQEQQHHSSTWDDDDKQAENGRKDLQHGRSPLDVLFESFPTCDEAFGIKLKASDTTSTSIDDAPRIPTSSSSSATLPYDSVDWDDVFQVANCLYAFRNHLLLQMPVSLNRLIDHLLRLESAGQQPSIKPKSMPRAVDGGKDSAHGNSSHSRISSASNSVEASATAAESKEEKEKEEKEGEMKNEILVKDKDEPMSSEGGINDDVGPQVPSAATDELNAVVKLVTVPGSEESISSQNIGFADSNTINNNTNNSNPLMEATTSSAVTTTASKAAAPLKKESMASDGEEEWDEHEAASSAAAYNASMAISNAVQTSTADHITSRPPGRPRKVLIDEDDVPEESTDHNLLNSAQGELDRIHLCLVRSLSASIHTMLDLNDTDDKHQSSAARLPLNQLTWPEWARMILINEILTEQGRSKEDIQHALRGSRQITFRLAKNIVRYSRYRLAARAKSSTPSSSSSSASSTGHSSSTNFTALPNKDHLSISKDVESGDRLFGLIQQSQDLSSTASAIMPSYTSTDDLITSDGDAKDIVNYDSETEILAALVDISVEPAYPVVYQRCAKVLIKLAGLSQAKNFYWEVDRVAYPDYYFTIVRPVMLTNITTSLRTKAYGSGEDYKAVAISFYNDVRQVAINCFTYNTEITPIVAQAQKIFQALWRHSKRWLFDPEEFLPKLQDCDEMHCLLTLGAITPINQIKCGRCCGTFSVDDMIEFANPSDATFESLTPEHEKFLRDIADYIVPPTREIREQQSEEWFCPFCLKEDTSATAPDEPFFLDEWGPSAMLPWALNTAHSVYASILGQSEAMGCSRDNPDPNPSLRRMLDAVMVLSVPRKSSIVHLDRAVMPDEVLKDVDFSVTQSWSFLDRIRVLAGLCEVFKASSGALDMLNRVNTECEKLAKICAKSSFREADFMKVVRDIAGEEGVVACRSLLDGIEEGLEADLHNRVTEGRCTVCKGSTYEDDCLEDDEIILCDGCNAEAHLRCLNMTSVPNTEWHCSACAERLALREARAGHTFQDVNRYRDREVEDDLINHAVDRKAALSRGANASAFTSEVRCAYCGLDELDLCSPLVVGQCRAEHDAYVARCKPPVADFIFPDKRGTAVKFYANCEIVETPPLEVPYFPPLGTKHADQLLREADGGDRKEAMIVHQMCALQMFQARMDRSRHALRRRRSVVAQRAINMAGINCRSLGTDDRGREYWRFPCSDDLYVRDSLGQSPVDEDELAFKEMLKLNLCAGDGQYNDDIEDEMDVVHHGHADGFDSSKCKGGSDQSSLRRPLHHNRSQWKRISDVSQMRRIVELLGHSPIEQSLRKNLVSGLLCDHKTDSQTDESATTTAGVAPSADGVASSSQVITISSGQQAVSNDPVVASTNTTSAAVKVDNSDTHPPVENGDAASTDVDGRLTRKPTVADNVPVELRLIRTKGQDVPSRYVIPQEFVFDEDEDSGDDSDDDLTHKGYFNFSRGRYYAVGLLNSAGKTVKNLRDSVKVTYQIHREGITRPLAYTPLDEPWSDNLYYFSTLLFKRSGNYTISFIVEGANAAGIKPLVFPVTVVAKQKRCGAQDAIERLRAFRYVQQGNRVFSNRRSRGSHDLFSVIQLGMSMYTPVTELHALRRAIAAVYLALPIGSMQMATPDSSSADVFGSIAESNGWNEVLDQAFRGAVENATSPATLMECALLLEFYINKAWLLAPSARLISSLSTHQFAVRCATYPAVALRIYSLDKAMAYDKVVHPSRERRYVEAPASTSVSNSRGGESASNSQGASNRRSRAIPRGFYAEDKYAEEEEETPSPRPSRSERVELRRKRQKEEEEDYAEESDDNNDDDDDDNADDDDASEGVPTEPGKWICSNCTYENPPRARTCETCDSRKPPSAYSGGSRSAENQRSRGRDQRRKPAREERVRRQRRNYGYSGDEEEEEEESHSRERGTRHSERKRAPVSYAAFDEYEEDDEFNGSYRNSNRTNPARSSRLKSARYGETGEDYKDINQGDDDNEEEEFESPLQITLDFDADIAALAERLKTEKEENRSLDAEATDMAIRMLSILRKLYKNPSTEIFWEPVDTSEYTDYRDYVQEPMDLGTITMNVKGDVFGTDHALFAKKVRLVWSNCRKYNKGHELAYMAQRLGAVFENLYNDYILSMDRPRNPDIR